MSDMLRDAVPSDKDTILTWRNHPEVRRNMYTKHVIAAEEHATWFGNSLRDPQIKLLVYERDGVGKGFVYFFNVNQEQATANWGFYSGDFETKGLGTAMEKAALEFAFRELLLEKLSCEVLQYNEPVIRLHQKFGFQIEGRFRQQHWFEGKRHDIIRLALFKKDWALMGRASGGRPFKPGDRFSLTRLFSVDDIDNFGRLTGDRNPVHFTDEAAQSAGFRGRVVHGMLVASSFSQILASHLPGSGSVYKIQNIEFHAAVYPDQLVRVEAVVRSAVGNKIFLDTTVSLEKENTVAVSGSALVFYPYEK